VKNWIPDTTRPAQPDKRRILLVANETVRAAALRDVVRLGVDGEPAVEVRVIAPALNSRLRHWLSDEDEARRSAGLRLDASLDGLWAAGIEAEGRVGDADPLLAIADELHQFDAQQIVIATRPGARSHWLTRDLVGRARRRFARPVLQVVGEPSDDSQLSRSTPKGLGPRGANGGVARRPQGVNAVSAPL
jgi:hypothetical protein